MADYDLDRLLAQVRRIEEHRVKGAEKEIRETYQKLLKDLRYYLADEYSHYAENDQLTYEILQRHGGYARFLEEVEQKINDITPETRRLIRSTVEQTYEATYNGMIDCVQKVATDLTVVAGLHGCTPDIIKRAVENPVSKLTLNSRLEKQRKEIIYNIKQNISVGLMNGDRYSTMAKRVQKLVEGDYKKAIRIVRTEAHRVREAGNHDAAQSVEEVLKTGESGMQMSKTWKTMRDERVRPAHRYKTKKGWRSGKPGKYDHKSMEGITIPVDEDFTLPSGATASAPGQSGVAGEDINCRCYLSYGLQEKESKYDRLERELRANNENELLPNYDNAEIPDSKISEYALNKNHPTGKDKAIAFADSLGYNIDNKDALIKEVRKGLGTFKGIQKNTTQYGSKYEVVMIVKGANGKKAKVKTGWIIETDRTVPRLTTIFVDK